MAFDPTSDLGGKLGPFPTWVWIVGGGSLAALVLYIMKRRGTSSTSSTGGTQPQAVLNPYAFGGISSGGATFPADTGGGVSTTPAPAATPSPAGLAGDAFPQQQQPAPAAASLPVCVPGIGQTCSLQYVQSGGIVFAPAASEWVGVKFASPTAPWQQAANQAIAQFMAQTPAQVPVGDLYGGIGLQTPAAAAAGGYWGANGSWVATPTPWTTLPGQPPLGNLAPGTPYATGSAYGVTIPSSGAPVQGVGVQYQPAR
jgi:hypothetical protein